MYVMSWRVKPPALVLNGLDDLDQNLAGIKLNSFSQTPLTPSEAFGRELTMLGYHVIYINIPKSEFSQEASFLIFFLRFRPS